MVARKRTFKDVADIRLGSRPTSAATPGARARSLGRKPRRTTLRARYPHKRKESCVLAVVKRDEHVPPANGLGRGCRPRHGVASRRPPRIVTSVGLRRSEEAGREEMRSSPLA